MEIVNVVFSSRIVFELIIEIVGSFTMNTKNYFWINSSSMKY